MGQYNRIFRTIGITGLAFAVNFLITLVLVPYITDIIGTEAYGWVKVAKDTILYCTMLMLAIQEFSTRFIGVSYHNGDYKKANEYFSSVFWGDVGLGSLIFVIAMIIVSQIDAIFQISPELTEDVQLLFLFTFLKFLQMTVLAVFECGPVIADRMNVAGRFKLLSYLSEAAALIILFRLFRPGVYLVGFALLISSIVTTIPNIVICRKYTPELKISARAFSIDAVKKLVGNGIWASLNSLSNFLNNGCDLLITDLMLSPLRMGQIAIVQSITVIVTSLAQIVSPAFQPVILKCYSHGDHRTMMKWFYLSMKTCGCLCGLLFAGFVTLGDDFYGLWIPNQDIRLLYNLTVIALIPGVTGGIIRPMFYAYTLTVKKKIPFFYALAGAIINVASMIVLLRFTNLGLYAVVITTTVCMTVDHLVLNGIYVCFVLGEPVWVFYRNVFRCLAADAAMAAVLIAMTMVLAPSSWLSFVGLVLLYSAVGTAVYSVVVFNSDERVKIITTIKTKIGG